jgi:enterochelin esterase-like enzyme
LPVVFSCYCFPCGSGCASSGASYSVVKVPAPSLDGNLTGEASMQSLGVFLPPSYDEGTRRYPVLYFFTGYYGNFDIGYLAKQVDQLMAECEFIVVSINDLNSLHGAFGAKSPVVGDWNSFFLNDAIPAVDRQFRTIAAPEGRAVCGTSMGGHIALRPVLLTRRCFPSCMRTAPAYSLRTGWRRRCPRGTEPFWKPTGRPTRRTFPCRIPMPGSPRWT